MTKQQIIMTLNPRKKDSYGKLDSMKKAGFKNGKIDLDNLTDAERNDYLRSLQEVDKSAEVRAKSWAEFVADEYSNIPFVTAMDERIDQAKRLLNKQRQQVLCVDV